MFIFAIEYEIDRLRNRKRDKGKETIISKGRSCISVYVQDSNVQTDRYVRSKDKGLCKEYMGLDNSRSSQNGCGLYKQKMSKQKDVPANAEKTGTRMVFGLFL